MKEALIFAAFTYTPTVVIVAVIMTIIDYQGVL